MKHFAELMSAKIQFCGFGLFLVHFTHYNLIASSMENIFLRKIVFRYKCVPHLTQSVSGHELDAPSLFSQPLEHGICRLIHIFLRVYTCTTFLLLMTLSPSCIVVPNNMIVQTNS